MQTETGETEKSRGGGQPFRWGEGRISGFLSATLGLMCLGGVLCFHFPWLLTTRDLVSRLDVQLLRYLLLFCLVVSFTMGLINFLINRCRALGYVGMVSAAVAVLLGGATVQSNGATAFSVAPLGLDALILGLLFNALLFIPFEKALPHRRDQVILRPEWQTDLAYFALANLMVSILMVVVTASGPVLFGWAAHPGLRRAVQSQPFWLQFAEIVLVADLAQYVTHRWYHTQPDLWRIHAVHHSVRTMDWLAGSRLHLLEVLLTRVAVFIPIYLIGFASEMVYVYIGFVSLHAVFIHANVGIDFGPLRYLVATPQFHHWHHSDDPRVMNHNFAVHLPVLDLLFGTHYQPRGEWPRSYGVIGESLPDGLVEQHLYPFRSR